VVQSSQLTTPRLATREEGVVKKTRAIGRIVALTIVVVGAGGCGGGVEPVVRIDSGEVRGVVSESGVAVFRGIPYAAPPVGELRWRPPQQIEPWPGIRDATEFGSACPQPDHLSGVYGIALPETSEDCLFLNVWTPDPAGETKLPVMVWIHGGSFYLGWGHQRSSYGGRLASRGAVVVTLNYRLGALGFMAHPDLTAESPHGSSGNYGLLDQIAALQWVKRNIAAVGGDPGRVTIFGVSAGAGSVNSLMASPLAAGLFHRAICQSGTAVGIFQGLGAGWAGQPPAEAMGERVAQRLGVDPAGNVLARMRSAPVDEILAAAPAAGGGEPTPDRFQFFPIVDGWVIPEPPYVVFSSGRQHDVPLIVGANANEGSVFVSRLGDPTAARYVERARQRYGPAADRFLELYPAAADQDVPAAYDRATTDERFVAGARFVARMTEGVSSDAFLYHFTRVRAGNERLGAYHGSEVGFVFDSFSPERPKDEADAVLTDLMGAYWVQFAATGNPNRDGLPEWPPYDGETDVHLELGDSVGTGTGLRRGGCDFFESLLLASVAAAGIEP
jgi:para-nitrobenzyl esterase